jgi:hypothetical protein
MMTQPDERAKRIIAMVAELAGVPEDEVVSMTWETHIEGRNQFIVERTPVVVDATPEIINAIRETYGKGEVE